MTEDWLKLNLFRCYACKHEHKVDYRSVTAGLETLLCPICKEIGGFTFSQETEVAERERDHWRDDDSPFGEFISSSSPYGSFR